MSKSDIDDAFAALQVVEPAAEYRVNKPRRIPSLFSKRGKGVNDFTQAELDRAIEIISVPGGNLRNAAEELGTSEPTLYRALNERCLESYTRARKQRASGHAHNIESLIDDIKTGVVPPDAGRVILDGLKWLAERMDRGLWGPQAETAPIDPTLGALAQIGAAAMREQLAAMVGALGIGQVVAVQDATPALPAPKAGKPAK